jgi:predicted RecA/RadA family phage recombinase
VATCGVFELSKVATDAMALGDVIYWDASARLATLTATDNTKLGVAVAAAGTGAVRVRLSGF